MPPLWLPNGSGIESRTASLIGSATSGSLPTVNRASTSAFAVVYETKNRPLRAKSG